MEILLLPLVFTPPCRTHLEGSMIRNGALKNQKFMCHQNSPKQNLNQCINANNLGNLANPASANYYFEPSEFCKLM